MNPVIVLLACCVLVCTASAEPHPSDRPTHPRSHRPEPHIDIVVEAVAPAHKRTKPIKRRAAARKRVDKHAARQRVVRAPVETDDAIVPVHDASWRYQHVETEDERTPPEVVRIVDEPIAVRAAPIVPIKRHHEPLVYFRAGGFHQESKLTAPSFTLETDLPVDTSAMAGSGVDMQESQIPIAAIVGVHLGHGFALETIAGLPMTARFSATGPLATRSLAPTFAGLPTGIEPLGSQLGEAKLGTPIVTAVYRLPSVGPVTAIAGAGGMLLYAYGERVTNPVLLAAGEPTLHITPTVGLVAQAGLDVKLWRNVAARLDVKYVAPMTVEARVDHIAVQPKALPQLGSIEVGSAVMTAKIAPIVIQAGIGADF